MAFALDLSFAGVGGTLNQQTERRTTPVRPAGRPRQILLYLLLSLLLHAVVLPWLKHDRVEMASPSAPPLSVILSPSRPEVHPEPTLRPLATQPTPAVARRTERLGAPVHTPSDAAPAPPPEPARPAIDLDATFAAARAMARGPELGPMPHAPKRQPTVESVIARAMAPQAVVEARGGNGEHVLRVGGKRCVTPLVAPHFMEGVTMLTQCELRKG